MKVVILAGGYGTRISEESHLRPKPMIEIGDKPILWHIMKIYSHYGLNDFVICLGYRGYMIKEYFANYVLHVSDVTVDIGRNEIAYHTNAKEPWRVTMVDTGEDTQTGGRLKRAADYLDGDGPFCMTYGDGLARIDIAALIDFHKAQGREATVTTVHPPARFGAAEVADGRVNAFVEKPAGDGSLINGGFFVLERSVLDRIEGDGTVWEKGPMEGLAADGALSAYVHEDFWQPMDTLREKTLLERLWSQGRAPWKVWD